MFNSSTYLHKHSIDIAYAFLVTIVHFQNSPYTALSLITSVYSRAVRGELPPENLRFPKIYYTVATVYT